MKTVAIIGVGLIGGSLGMALRRSGRYRVIGIGRHPVSLKKAHKLGAVDTWSQNFSDIKDADIVVIATPVSLIVSTVKEISGYLKKGAIVTDVGSVKGEILIELSKSNYFKGTHPSKSASFVGAHPIAGSHKTGISFANENLFKKAICVIVPSHLKNQHTIAEMWQTAGAIPVYMTAEEHDQVVGLISHLPHVLAHAMVHSVMKDKKKKLLKRLLAGSFRDVTRVASSDADQWTSILNANATFTKQAIRRFVHQLQTLEKKIGTRTLAPYLRQSQKYREPLFQS